MESEKKKKRRKEIVDIENRLMVGRVKRVEGVKRSKS